MQANLFILIIFTSQKISPCGVWISNSESIMNEIEIKQVVANQISELQEICRKTFYEAFKAENTEEDMLKYLEEGFALDRLTAELNNKDSQFYFALAGQEIIGYMKLNSGRAQTEQKEDHSLEIERIYVLPQFFGKKVGQLLFEKAYEVSQCLEVDYLWLGVWEHNHRALKFYRRNGFVEFGKHLFMLGDDEQTDLTMKLQFK